jgi:hypothetical protein
MLADALERRAVAPMPFIRYVEQMLPGRLRGAEDELDLRRNIISLDARSFLFQEAPGEMERFRAFRAVTSSAQRSFCRHAPGGRPARRSGDRERQ